LAAVSKDITIEDLVVQIPESVNFLREKGIVCIICGEPVWGTLSELAERKGLSVKEIDEIIDYLNSINR
jgi:iron-sulfur cluster repair protein YtfE (RIC family)